MSLHEITAGASTIWTYNGGEYELDLSDYEDGKRFEECMDAFAGKAGELKLDGSLSERVLAYDKIVRELYDRMFGLGSGDKILGERRNARICDESFLSLCEFIAKQKADDKARQDNFIAKYGPANRIVNRASRRHAKK